MMNILVGADPEVFVKEGNRFISGYDMIPGTKTKPHKVDRGAVQVDGMALEFNINPAESKTEFVYSINHVLSHLKTMIPDNNDIVIEPVATFSPEYMFKQPEKAVELGCDPDFNAYSQEVNKAPEQHPTMRTAAGHIHVGWTQDQDIFDNMHLESCYALVKQLDYFLGVPSILEDPDNKRREMYGKAGSFRPKPYGCEYRVLSNYWLKEDMVGKVYDRTIQAVEDLMAGNKYDDMFLGSAENIINNNVTEAAEVFVEAQGWL